MGNDSLNWRLNSAWWLIGTGWFIGFSGLSILTDINHILENKHSLESTRYIYSMKLIVNSPLKQLSITTQKTYISLLISLPNCIFLMVISSTQKCSKTTCILANTLANYISLPRWIPLLYTHTLHILILAFQSITSQHTNPPSHKADKLMLRLNLTAPFFFSYGNM